ncbi:35214_t:CDS:2 [Racocetra persica]|uniref:35214_t:CDS:1 n=1 Tax=Racocetra persica TaxID=160502 RepID=A0ACA9MIP3_9GLOM|nr:35214_t:CDS:2 [Racocetra persica]
MECRIAGIYGSLRRDSCNKKLILRAQQLCAEHVPKARIDIIDWSQLPVFNQDLEEDPPNSVLKLKEEIGNCDAILFSTPGPLKNAIDWASRTRIGNRGDVLSKKPVAVISTCSSGTGSVQTVLNQILIALNMITVDTPSIMLSGAYKTFQEDGSLKSKEIEEKIVKLLNDLVILNKRLKDKF